MDAVTKEAFRNAMSRLGAAVHIVTTAGEGGRVGFTASAVCSVTDEPPTLLVCLNRVSALHEAFAANKVLCVNTLSFAQQDLANLFASKAGMTERFAQGDWQTALTGAPVLANASVVCDCKITASTVVGTHEVMFCEVLMTRVDLDKNGLIYYDREYHPLPARNDLQ